VTGQKRWDSSRPIPWRRLVREWLLYGAIMIVVFALFFRNDNLVGALIGIVFSFPLYLGLGFVLAKLGYQRQRLGERTVRERHDTADTSSGSARTKPTPTKRTATGSNRPVSTSKRHR
jgi:hypothetical protein